MEQGDRMCRTSESIETEIICYVETTSYKTDLLATQMLWKTPRVFGTAGIFIFLSYLTVPDLTTISGGNDPMQRPTMRLGLDGVREERFLRRILGLDTDDEWHGGIRNPKVRSLAVALRNRHEDFVGMQYVFMEFIAGIVAISALRALIALNYEADTKTRTGYWRYLRYAVALLGVQLNSERDVVQNCEAFIDEHAGPSLQGQQMLASLISNHPEYIGRAMPALFPKSRAAVLDLLTTSGVRSLALEIGGSTPSAQ